MKSARAFWKLSEIGNVTAKAVVVVPKQYRSRTVSEKNKASFQHRGGPKNLDLCTMQTEEGILFCLTEKEVVIFVTPVAALRRRPSRAKVVVCPRVAPITGQLDFQLRNPMSYV